jgi:hypothetical protein
MSDDLHTRIMAIVATAVTDEKSASRGVPLDMCVADHLIRELGLRREDDYDKFLGKIMGHRYVTEWTTDGVDSGT